MAAKRPHFELQQKDNKKAKTDVNSEESDSKNNSSKLSYLSDLSVYILPAGIEKARLGIFQSQISKNGGCVHEKWDHSVNTTHIIVDDKMDIPRLLRLMQLDSPPKIPIVKSAWLSVCLRKKELVSCDDFRLPVSSSGTPEANEMSDKTELTDQEETVLPSKPKDHSAKAVPVYYQSKVKPAVNNSDSDYEPSDDEAKLEESASTATDASRSVSPRKPLPVEKWICAQSSKNPRPNMNKHITGKLEEMVKAYESTNDKWRAFGYQKAIQALRRHPKEISSWEEAKALPGVGGRLADKIWEIAQSGELRKLKEFESSEEVRVLKMFTDVWGAGPHTAQVWYQQGFRTIDDLKTKAHLNHQQEVGVRLYDDLLDRMPRAEAAEIEQVVKEAAESIQEGIIAQACGSYRRGKATCGDVDVLITHPDGKSHKGIFHKLLSKLKESGFITDDLVSAEETGNQKKYLGVCKLPGENRKHRRLDIIVVPYEEYGCALVYFTGSAHFNRSLRHLCKKQNMSLNEHALKTGVVRKGAEKIYEGTVVPTPTEESVFTAMKIPYRPPEERDH